MEDIILVGYGGHAKSVADCIRRQSAYSIVGYTDIECCRSPLKYLGTDETLPEWYRRGVKNAAVCVGYLGRGDLREKLYRRLKQAGFHLPVITDPSAVISDSAQIGEGVFIGKGAVINADAAVGRMAIINTNAVVEHGCRVGDYTHVAVGAVLCGDAEVGDGCLIGANAAVLQTLHIGNHAVVGAGVVVTKNIRDGVVMGRKSEFYERSYWQAGQAVQKLPIGV